MKECAMLQVLRQRAQEECAPGVSDLILNLPKLLQKMPAENRMFVAAITGITLNGARRDAARLTKTQKKSV